MTNDSIVYEVENVQVSEINGNGPEALVQTAATGRFDGSSMVATLTLDNPENQNGGPQQGTEYTITTSNSKVSGVMKCSGPATYTQNIAGH